MTQGAECEDGNQDDVDACTNGCHINFKAVPCDGDRTGEVTVDEILAAVSWALQGCGAGGEVLGVGCWGREEAER